MSIAARNGPRTRRWPPRTARAGGRSPGCRRVVAALSAWGKIRLRHLHDNASPGTIPLRVHGRVAERVLARELIGDLAVHAVQFLDVCLVVRLAAGFLVQLPHHELRFA